MCVIINQPSRCIILGRSYLIGPYCLSASKTLLLLLKDCNHTFLCHTFLCCTLGLPFVPRFASAVGSATSLFTGVPWSVSGHTTPIRPFWFVGFPIQIAILPNEFEKNVDEQWTFWDHRWKEKVALNNILEPGNLVLCLTQSNFASKFRLVRVFGATLAEGSIVDNLQQEVQHLSFIM